MVFVCTNEAAIQLQVLRYELTSGALVMWYNILWSSVCSLRVVMAVSARVHLVAIVSLG